MRYWSSYDPIWKYVCCPSVTVVSEWMNEALQFQNQPQKATLMHLWRSKLRCNAFPPRQAAVQGTSDCGPMAFCRSGAAAAHETSPTLMRLRHTNVTHPSASVALGAQTPIPSWTRRPTRIQHGAIFLLLYRYGILNSYLHVLLQNDQYLLVYVSFEAKMDLRTTIDHYVIALLY